ncbi:N-acetylmuramoyl-L-alanine amidase [Clostridium cylindrosporum]|uniref:N-acetylmuramoyl-L-alanine amidase n=1 Tax=Clostridium cylindrosporum DSM 605 TaxID=1121307 RepID=A0A0J8D4T0_CLOCY|nr:N-acetylmuramoyl-L-alanine amidase [Clostridium cylindrosporum]KMT21170.1 N-acetylmuramoyl-L-alanine amidase [Clostridium cylindrosporum DSM 605]
MVDKKRLVIGIDMGHTFNPANYGGVGIRNEVEETRKVGEKLIRYLECMGHRIVNVTVDYADTQEESLSERVRRANAQRLDLFVSLHFNKFNGERNGSEVYTYRGRRLPAAVRTLNNLGNLGFKKTGIFDGSKLYLIKNTKAPAMLVEIAYIDSPIDMEIYDPELVARALAEGITGQKIPQACPNRREENNSSQYRFITKDGEIVDRDSKRNSLYRVCVGGCLSYEKARDITLEIKELGYTVAMEVIE